MLGLLFLAIHVVDSLSSDFVNSSYTNSSTTCLLQFTSPCDKDADCGDLNGYKMLCVGPGLDKHCGFSGDDTQKFQHSSAIPGTIPQFGDCTGGLACSPGHGFTPMETQRFKTCEETLYCMQEQNDAPNVALTSQCHTCGSCWRQNGRNAQENKIARFNCDVICPEPPAPPTEKPSSFLDLDASANSTGAARKSTIDTDISSSSNTLMVSACSAIIGTVALSLV
jgi:hypothetical protein